jgi:hypothetical protein
MTRFLRIVGRCWICGNNFGTDEALAAHMRRWHPKGVQ